jgi:MFS family permease
VTPAPHLYGQLFLMSLYLQDIRGYSALPYAILVAPMAAAGFGMALTMPAATAAVIEAAPADRGGIASGVVNAARQSGGVLGVALPGSMAHARAAMTPASTSTSAIHLPSGWAATSAAEW